jgi:hypothetical protein
MTTCCVKNGGIAADRLRHATAWALLGKAAAAGHERTFSFTVKHT